MAPTSVRKTFLPDLGASRLARRWTYEQLDPLGIDDLSMENILLATSEIVTNVITHTSSAPTITLRVDPPQICVEVMDSSSRMPITRDAKPGRPGGWGLRIVDRAADRWGATLTSSGHKVVWFTVAGA
ncbi:MAG: protein serine/threonine phosphatase [Ilumatobacteraceae bacterium]|nr:protein serine/threonine phosphatase [Ilumatobacteraceae bacterium]